MRDEDLARIAQILNEPGMTWKVRRALLRHEFTLSEDAIAKLIPEPSGDFHPCDY